MFPQIRWLNNTPLKTGWHAIHNLEHTDNTQSPRKGFRDYTYSHKCLMSPKVLLSGATQQAWESSVPHTDILPALRKKGINKKTIESTRILGYSSSWWNKYPACMCACMCVDACVFVVSHTCTCVCEQVCRNICMWMETSSNSGENFYYISRFSISASWKLKCTERVCCVLLSTHGGLPVVAMMSPRAQSPAPPCSSLNLKDKTWAQRKKTKCTFQLSQRF